MVISTCDHSCFKKNGKTKGGDIRYRCTLCGKSWTAFTQAFEGMRVGMDMAVKIISLLCEGVSVRATSRLTGVDKNTVIGLSVLVGQRCAEYMARTFQNLHVDDVQVDEIWQFIFCKRYTAKKSKYVGGCGDSYCFTAIERHTKLLICWHMGRRTEGDTIRFCQKLSDATTGRFQLSTDGWAAYPFAVLSTLRNRVDYGMLVKIFGDTTTEDRRKYSPPQIIDTKRNSIMGEPDNSRICTSHVERLNGSIRTFCKRMGRLTYCFSKRWDNHKAALAMFFCHYNFCRKHCGLKGLTPAMAHGLEIHAWSVREILEKVMEIGHT